MRPLVRSVVVVARLLASSAVVAHPALAAPHGRAPTQLVMASPDDVQNGNSSAQRAHREAIAQAEGAGTDTRTNARWLA